MTNREAVAHNSILSSVLEAYGHTPLIKLSKIAEDEGLECDICELHENKELRILGVFSIT